MYTVSDTIIQLLGQKFKPYAVNRTRNFPNPLVWRYVLAREYGYKSYSEVKKAIERVRQKNRENLRRLMEECR